MRHQLDARVAAPVLAAVLVLAVASEVANARPNHSSDLFAVGDNFSLGGSYYSGSMIGLGYRFNSMFGGNNNLGWSVGGQYTKGMIKNTYTTGGLGGTSSTSEQDPSSYAIYLQLDHYYDCCDFDCGPELYYENTSLLVKQSGLPDDKLSGINMIGAGGHFGGSYPLSKSVGVFGEYAEIFGYRSFDHTQSGNETKYSAWTFQPNYHAGLRFNF